jgi:hypothetical protein
VFHPDIERSEIVGKGSHLIFIFKALYVEFYMIAIPVFKLKYYL